MTASAQGFGVCEILHVPFKLFTRALWLCHIQVLLACKARCSGSSSSQCRNPWLGSPMWGLELLLLGENLCSCGYPSSCGSLTPGVWLLSLLHLHSSYPSHCDFFLTYLFLAALGLHCCMGAFSSCSEWGLLFVVVRGLLIAVASLVAEHRL